MSAFRRVNIEIKMVLSYIVPTEDSDYAGLSRLYAVCTAVALFLGHPIVASCLALLEVYILQVIPYQKSSSNEEQVLDMWFMLSSISATAGVASWVLLFLSSLETDENGYRTWFFGQALQKLWAIALFVALYQDMTPTTKVEPSLDGTRKVRRLQRQGSLVNNFLKIHVRILEGRNLVAKDFNMFRRDWTSSDPYVILRFGQNQMGKTSVVHKSLNPKWLDANFRVTVIPRSIELYQSVECTLFDHDKMSKDDPMGTVHIPIPPCHNTKVLKWYPVETGTGDNYCEDAQGELLVEIEVVVE